MRWVPLGHDPDEDDNDPDYDPFDIDYPDLTLEVDGPEVLGVLYDARGEVGWTLLDRPMLPFGFCSQRQEEP